AAGRTSPPRAVQSPNDHRRAGSHVLDPPGLYPSVIDPLVSPARAHAPISTYTFSTHKFYTHKEYSCPSTLSNSTANRSPSTPKTMSDCYGCYVIFSALPGRITGAVLLCR